MPATGSSTHSNAPCPSGRRSSSRMAPSGPTASLSRQGFLGSKAALREGLHLSEQIASSRNSIGNLALNKFFGSPQRSGANAREDCQQQLQPRNAASIFFSDHCGRGLICPGAEATLGEWCLRPIEAGVV